MFIVQRINLLSEELTQTFASLPGSLKSVKANHPGGPLALQAFLRNRINGPGESSLLVALAGTGPKSSPIPAVNSLSGPGSGPTATLYTSQALSAIETSRAATLNATSYLVNKTFKHNQH